jgi:antitoxin YefM
MRVVTYSAFRENLASYMDQVAADRTELHVTRQGAPSVVVLSEEEFSSIMETLHLMRSPANAARLNAAIADIEAGKVTEFDPTTR